VRTSSPPELRIDFLTDGGQPAGDVVDRLVAFLDASTRSLDVAIYDFRAAAGASARIGDALERASRRGVAVRVAFNVDRSRHTSPPPMQADPARIDGLDVPTRAIRGDGTLMHHKYVVRDGRTVWTGSTNWTDDSFSREENVIVQLDAAAIAAAFASNFEQMWTSGHVESSGGASEPAVLPDGSTVRAYFSPRGPSLSHVIATQVGAVHRRLRVLSPVLTSGPILGTLAELTGRESLDVNGAFDATQMHEVVGQWQGVPDNHWKIDAWRTIAPRLAGKRSTPYAEGSIHDYMHAKAVIVGDDVLTGSFNLSRHGESNAENVLHITSQSAADRFTSFADGVAARLRSRPDPAAAGVPMSTPPPRS
jgi:phosphatidylserine/phosphatidylglycerophosphate/cardiolipin synthase-like enzyme